MSDGFNGVIVTVVDEQILRSSTGLLTFLNIPTRVTTSAFRQNTFTTVVQEVEEEEDEEVQIGNDTNLKLSISMIIIISSFGVGIFLAFFGSFWIFRWRKHRAQQRLKLDSLSFVLDSKNFNSVSSLMEPNRSTTNISTTMVPRHPLGFLYSLASLRSFSNPKR
jgi:hypothetical protein